VNKEKVYRIGLVMLSGLTSLFVAAAKQGEIKEPPHCVVKIEPLKPGEKSSEMSEPVCFDSFSGAIYFATDGKVSLDASVTADKVTDEN
jgi:hypothetical protein